MTLEILSHMPGEHLPERKRDKIEPREEGKGCGCLELNITFRLKEGR